MTIFELSKKYDELVETHGEDKELIYKLFSSSFKTLPFPSDEMMAIIRSIDQTCTKKVGGVEYLDQSLRTIALSGAFYTHATDLELKDVNRGSGESKSDMIRAFDEIRKLRLDEYMYDKYLSVIERFDLFVRCEEENFNLSHGISTNMVIKAPVDGSDANVVKKSIRLHESNTVEVLD